MEYKNKKVLVMGLGLYPKGSGISAIEFLYKKGANITVTDLKNEKELASQLKRLKKYKGIKYVLGRHRISDFKNKDLIVKNPGVPSSSVYIKEAKKNKIPIMNDITLFLSQVKNPIIGITGTRGKSTTATLTYEIIKEQFKNTRLGGNIKVSPLNFVNKIKDDDIIILELSSWMLHNFKEIKFSPQISVVTNIKPDHLNSYSSMYEYVKDKMNIVKYQKSCDLLILNKDDYYDNDFAEASKAQKYYITIDKKLNKDENGVFLQKNKICIQEDGAIITVLDVEDIKILGKHNLYNVMYAIIVSYLSGVSLTAIKRVVKTFKGIDSRLKKIRIYKGVDFYNDTTATTPDASIAGIKSFSKNIILIAGGSDKKLEYSDFIKVVNKNIKTIILLPGKATDKFADQLKVKNIIYVDSMKDAVLKSWEHAKKNDIILLSPASASFGLFTNEFDRGDKFIKEVKKLR